MIDDDHLVLEGFKFLFEDDPDIRLAWYSTSMKSALQGIKYPGIDLIILDINLRAEEPIDNIRILRKEFPKIPIVILTGDDHIDSKISTFNEGVSAYMVKSPDLEEMRVTIKYTMNGKKVIPLEVLSLSNIESELAKSDGLTWKEQYIMKQLTTGKRYKEIGESLCLTSDAVRKAVDLLKERFRCNTKEQLLTNLVRLKVI